MHQSSPILFISLGLIVCTALIGNAFDRRSPYSKWQIREFHAPEDIPHERVEYVTQAPDGAIWIATRGGGVAQLHGGVTTVYNTENGLPSNDVRCVSPDQYGGVWAATRGGISYIQPNGHVVTFTTETTPEIRQNFFYQVLIDTRGRVWMGNAFNQIFLFEWETDPNQSLEGTWTEIEHPFKDYETTGWVTDFLLDSKGFLWISFAHTNLLQLNPDTLTIENSYPHDMFDVHGGIGESQSIAESPLGEIRLITVNTIFTIKEEKIISQGHGLPATFSGIYHQGNFLLGGNGGLHTGDNLDWTAIPLHSNRTSPRVDHVFIAEDESIWLGTRSGLYRIMKPLWESWLNEEIYTWQEEHEIDQKISVDFKLHVGEDILVFHNDHTYQYDNGKWSPHPSFHFSDIPEHNSEDIDNLFVDFSNLYKVLIDLDRKQKYEIGTSFPLPFRIHDRLIQGRNQKWLLLKSGLYRWDGNSFELFPLQQEGEVRGIAFCENTSRKWVLIQTHNIDHFLGHIEVYTPDSSRIIEIPHDLPLLDSFINDVVFLDDKLYFTSDSSGLFVYDFQEWTQIQPRKELPTQGLQSLYVDNEQTMWVGSKSDGISSFMDGRWIHYNSDDGLLTGELRTIQQQNDGTLWVKVRDRGVARFQPEQEPPSAQILLSPERIPPGDKGFFLVSGRDAFKTTRTEDLAYSWRILTTNGESLYHWSPFSTQTTILTPRLEPGDYRFEVLSQDKSRNTSLSPATASFTVVPYFWTTSAFLIPVSLAFTIALIALLLWYASYRRVQESERRYRNLLDKDAATLVMNWDDRGRVTYYNEACVSLYGAAIPNFMERPVEEWITSNALSTLRTFRETISQAMMNLDTAQPCTLPLRTDSHTHWISWFIRATSSRTNSSFDFHAVGVDVTEQVLAEQKLDEERTSFYDFCERAGIGLLRVSDNDQPQMMNTSLRKRIGTEELLPDLDTWTIDSSWLDLIHFVRNTGIEDSRNLHGICLATGKPFYALVIAVQKHEHTELLIIDTTEERRLQEQISEMSHYEQQKLGRELHDGLGQQLAALVFLSNRMIDKTNPDTEIHTLSRKMKTHLSEALEQARLISKGLNPVTLYSSGLRAAIQQLIQSYCQVYPIRIEIASYSRFPDSDEAGLEAMYRIIREAMFNSLKHARANLIVIDAMILEDGWMIRVLDDGVGFPETEISENESGMGIKIIRYYANRINAEVRWISNNGTEFVLQHRSR